MRVIVHFFELKVSVLYPPMVTAETSMTCQRNTVVIGKESAGFELKRVTDFRDSRCPRHFPSIESVHPGRRADRIGAISPLLTLDY